MPVESGRFKAFVGFTSWPQTTTITYKDDTKLEVLSSDLIFLRALVNKAIEKVAQLSPTDEEKASAAKDREYIAKLKSQRRPVPLLRMGELQHKTAEQKHASHQNGGAEVSSEGVDRWRARRTRGA